MFGLNRMVCNGIRDYFQSANGKKHSNEVSSIFKSWRSGNCSKEGYNILDTEMNMLSRKMKIEYGQVWSGTTFQLQLVFYL